MRKVVLIIYFLFLFTMIVSCQDTTSYWKIKTIYRDDNSPFIGLTNVRMQEYIDKAYHFYKQGDSLYFDFPEKKIIHEQDLYSLDNARYGEMLTDSIYYKGITGIVNRIYKIKFIDQVTFGDSDKTVIEFNELTKDEYENSLIQEKKFWENINNAVLELRNKFIVPTDLGTYVKLAKKNIQIKNTKNEEFIIKVPEKDSLVEYRGFINKSFGELKAGTFEKNSSIYELMGENYQYSFDMINIFLIENKKGYFNFNDYFKNNSSKIIENNDNFMFSINFTYDFKLKKAVPTSYHILKYYKVENTYIFIFSEIIMSVNTQGIHALEKERLEVVRKNYNLIKNIELLK